MQLRNDADRYCGKAHKDSADDLHLNDPRNPRQMQMSGNAVSASVSMTDGIVA